MSHIFRTSYAGFTVTLYKNRLAFRKLGMEEDSIVLSQIASVTVAMPLMQLITVETTGGKKFKLVVRLRDKKKLRDLIYDAIDNQ
ncbi:MAG: hypothetical protein KAS32_17595 [Candidatus Peribacteraceae bacterium]|nr:hypothetical protein [Candidatus Peribacteraceae bacterium]